MGFFLACALTVLIETGLFALFGYRSRDALTIVACANIVTNLSLNLGLSLSGGAGTPVILFLEAAVTAAEYVACACAFGHSWKLFLLTLAANILSFSAGLLVF